MPILQRLRDKAASPGTLLDVVNEEVVPVLRRLRDTVNRWLTTPQNAQIDAGTLSIDWTAFRHYRVSLGQDVVAIAFADPTDSGEYHIVFEQTGAFTVTGWPANVRWFGGSAPTITATAGKVDVATFLWDGTSYLASVRQNA